MGAPKSPFSETDMQIPAAQREHFDARCRRRTWANENPSSRCVLSQAREARQTIELGHRGPFGEQFS